MNATVEILPQLLHQANRHRRLPRANEALPKLRLHKIMTKFNDVEMYIILHRLKELDSFLKLRFKSCTATDLCSLVNKNSEEEMTWKCVNENLKKMQDDNLIKKQNGRWMITDHGKEALKALKISLKDIKNEHEIEFAKHKRALGE